MLSGRRTTKLPRAGLDTDAPLPVEPSQRALFGVTSVEHHRTAQRVLVGVEVAANVTVIASGDSDLRAVRQPGVAKHRMGHVTCRDAGLADSGLALVPAGAGSVVANLGVLAPRVPRGAVVIAIAFGLRRHYVFSCVREQKTITYARAKNWCPL